MSHHIEQPAGYGHHVAVRGHVNAGKAVTIAALVTVITVGVAYAIATPFSRLASSALGSFVSAEVPIDSTTARLSAPGLDALLKARFGPIGDVVTQQGTTAARQATTILTDASATLSPHGTLLTLTVPAIARIASSLQAALTPIGVDMRQLDGSDGQVANAVNNTVIDIDPVLNLTGPGATLSANVPIDLDAAIAADLTNTSGAGAVTLDPHTGIVTVDLSKLIPNDVPGDQTGTGLALSATAIAEIGADINAAASVLAEKVVNSATQSVEGTPVDVNANVHFLTQPSTTSTGGPGYCSTPSSGSTTSSTPTHSSGLVGDTLGNLFGGVVGTVDGLVCSVPSNLLPALPTTLSLNLDGNIGQIIEGTATPAAVSLSMLGEPTPFDASKVSDAVANTLVENFMGTTETDGSNTGHGSRGSFTSRGTVESSGSSTASGLGQTIGTQLGEADGGLPSGLNLGGITGPNGTGITAGILNSLTIRGTHLPLGISATVGSGIGTGSSGTTGSSTSSGSKLLTVHAGTDGNGLNASVGVGNPTPATVSISSGSSTTSSGTGTGGILGLHIGTSTTGGTSSGQGTILNLGF